MRQGLAETGGFPAMHAPAAAPPAATLSDLRFRTLLGEERWAQLPATTRVRFSHRLADCRTASFSGRVVECRMSAAGWVLAQLARLIGGPLPTSRAVGVPAAVAVTEDASAGGQFWTRIYGRRRGFPQVIHSSKRFAGPTGLLEYVGRGFAIALRLETGERTLDFVSDHYRWRERRIPGWLSPGELRVSHLDFGGGAFAFRLVLCHPWLGELIRQNVHFRDHPPFGEGEPV